MTSFRVPRPSRRHALAAGGGVFLAAFSMLLPSLLPGISPTAEAAAKKRLLVVTVTKGFRHDVIPASEQIIKEMGDKSGAFTVDYVRTDAEMADKMTPAGLKKYDGVFFANTTGELPIPDREAFLKWIADGHGFIGAHAATDTYHEYEPYKQMIGGEFRTHGPQVGVKGRVEDKNHPATKSIGDTFSAYD